MFQVFSASNSCNPGLFVFPAKAQVYEKVSLQGIQQLVHRSYQTLTLWKLLCDHQFSLIMSELPKVRVCTNTSPVGQLQTPIRHHCSIHPHALLNAAPLCFHLNTWFILSVLVAHSATFSCVCRSSKSR